MLIQNQTTNFGLIYERMPDSDYRSVPNETGNISPSFFFDKKGKRYTECFHQIFMCTHISNVECSVLQLYPFFLQVLTNLVPAYPSYNRWWTTDDPKHIYAICHPDRNGLSYLCIFLKVTQIMYRVTQIIVVTSESTSHLKHIQHFVDHTKIQNLLWWSWKKFLYGIHEVLLSFPSYLSALGMLFQQYLQTTKDPKTSFKGYHL